MVLSGLVVADVLELFWGITWRSSDIPPSGYSRPHAKLRKQWNKKWTLSTGCRTQYCSDWTRLKNLVRCFTPVWKQLLPVSSQQPSKVHFSTQERINHWWIKGCQDWALALKSHSIGTGDKDLGAIFTSSNLLKSHSNTGNQGLPGLPGQCDCHGRVDLVLLVCAEVERRHRKGCLAKCESEHTVLEADSLHQREPRDSGS